MELFKVISLQEAKDILNTELNYKLEFEKIGIMNCIGRVSYKDINARENIPDFRRSTVDGYAVNSRDVFGASEAIPAIMELKGEVIMGNTPPALVKQGGECLYVPTGGMLPEGTDSVVMVEYTTKLDDNTVLVEEPAAPGSNVIQVGEDISTGETVIKAGKKLRPYEIGVLSSLGICEVEVYKKPRIGIISTGDELVACDKTPAPGEIRDINTYLLWSNVYSDGAEPASYGIIRDDYSLLKDAVDRAINECDVVLISGGSSVGLKDQTLSVINSYSDGGVLVHGLSVKPGKPTIIGKAKGKAVFGLPGHPLACSIIYRILVKDYIDKLMNREDDIYGISATFPVNYHKAKGREEYLPVTLERTPDGIVARPLFGKSGLITVYSRAWGYVRIDKNLEGLREGDRVEVFKF